MNHGCYCRDCRVKNVTSFGCFVEIFPGKEVCEFLFTKTYFVAIALFLSSTALQHHVNSLWQSQWGCSGSWSLIYMLLLKVMECACAYSSLFRPLLGLFSLLCCLGIGVTLLTFLFFLFADMLLELSKILGYPSILFRLTQIISMRKFSILMRYICTYYNLTDILLLYWSICSAFPLYDWFVYGIWWQGDFAQRWQPCMKWFDADLLICHIALAGSVPY